MRDGCIFLAPRRETDPSVSGADVAEERAEDEARHPPEPIPLESARERGAGRLGMVGFPFPAWGWKEALPRVKTGGLSAERAARNPWTKRVGRLGFAGKGVLYAIIGVLAITVAAEKGGNPEDQKGALQAVADEPFGMILLVLLALGLTGYALWQLVEVVVGPREKEGVEAHAKRAFSLGRTVIYGSLSAYAWAIVAGSGESVSSGGSQQQQTATVLGWPGGVALVAVVGIVVIGIAVYQGYQAATQGFLEDLKLGEMSEQERRAATYLGVGGHIARGVVFALIGVFLVKAALEYDSQEAIGLGGALKEVAGQPYGSFLLGLVAAGLLLYGLYCLVESRYRKL